MYVCMYIHIYIYMLPPPQKKTKKNYLFHCFFLPLQYPPWSTLLAKDMLSYLFVRDAERNIGKMGRTKLSKHLIWRKMLLQENAAYRLQICLEAKIFP